LAAVDDELLAFSGEAGRVAAAPGWQHARRDWPAPLPGARVEHPDVAKGARLVAAAVQHELVVARGCQRVVRAAGRPVAINLRLRPLAPHRVKHVQVAEKVATATPTKPISPDGARAGCFRRRFRTRQTAAFGN